ncbi:MAG: hypothetical protein ACXWUG_22410 [Polyangiales bacterium]
MRHLGTLALLALTAAACNGKTTETPTPSVVTDPNSPPVSDNGAAPIDPGKVAGPIVNPPPSETYPAYTPEVPQLRNNGGDVLKNPEIVTITWPGETNADTFEAFGDSIGSSEYWKTLVSEYGVGAAVSGADRHVRMTDAAPTSISDSELDALVAAKAGDPATSKWPAPNDQILYVLYLPRGTSLILQGSDACMQGVGGYHTSTDVGGQQVAYAILPQCGKSGKPDYVTGSASHEIAEAATDPHPMAQPGWVEFDNDHLAWSLFQQFQTENGDACEFYRTSMYRESEPAFAFAVQRQWSNASAKAGHDPCVPAPSGAYFNVSPLHTERVYADLSAYHMGTNVKSMGYHVAVGETRTFPIGFWSDGPTDAWTIKVYEGNPLLGTSSTKKLELSVDRSSGKNGEQAFITVKVLAAGKTKTEFVTVVSTLGGRQTFMPILIGSK